MKLNCLEIPLIHFSTFYHPLQGLTKTLVQYRSAGLSNGRQTFQCPRTRMALAQGQTTGWLEVDLGKILSSLISTAITVTITWVVTTSIAQS